MTCCNRILLSLLGLNLMAAWAVAADPIVASPNLPASSPWNLEQLSQAPAFEWLDETSPVRSLTFAGEPYNGQPTRVFAYYATPGTLQSNAAADKDLPAVVLVHGGGGTAFREWAELWASRGYAAIAMDLAGYRPIEGANAHARENRVRLDQPGPDQGDDEKFGSIDKPVGEQWPYHAVANVIRAHSLVRSFPEVDRSRTAVTGISWGGYLTCIVAGVDSRFRAAVPVYGCGFLDENSAWLDRFAKMTPEQRQRWVSLWDPSHYLRAAALPMLFVNGTNDFAYPLDSYMKSFDVVPGEKQLRVTVNMPHGHPPGWAPQEIGWFVDQHLLGKPALPVLQDPQVDGETLRLTWQGPMPPTRATLHVSSDRGAINQRTWQDLPATIDGQTITATVPAAASTWFVTIEDSRGAIVSSRVIIH